jgi:hypothetical protein
MDGFVIFVVVMANGCVILARALMRLTVGREVEELSQTYEYGAAARRGCSAPAHAEASLGVPFTEQPTEFAQLRIDVALSRLKAGAPSCDFAQSFKSLGPGAPSLSSAGPGRSMKQSGVGNKLAIARIAGNLADFVRPLCASRGGRRRLLAAAGLLHLTMAVGLFVVGRAQVAPGFIDRDGIISSFAFDSYEYQRGAARLTEVLRQEGLAAWAAEQEPLHVKLISLQFALLRPLFGHSALSAEPLNLFCYLAVVWLTFGIGREVGGEREGVLAAAVVALWPTLLLHSLQLLKDPLFIAGALALVLCVTTWLTRTYSPARGLATGALTAVAVSLLLLIRVNFVAIIFALALLGFALLVVRQLAEGRALYWNMASPLLILAGGALLLFFQAGHAVEKFKQHPSDAGGRVKESSDAKILIPTEVFYLPRTIKGPPVTAAGRTRAAADRAAFRIGTARSKFAATYSDSGSLIDQDVKFRDLGDLLSYVPRAFQIGLWSPFPNTWGAAGGRVGSAGKLLSGAETLLIYVCELLAIVAVLRAPRRLAAWLLLSITVFGVTMLGLVVPNVGALYRFRYTFWVLLIILGAIGLGHVISSSLRRLRTRSAT